MILLSEYWDFCHNLINISNKIETKKKNNSNEDMAISNCFVFFHITLYYIHEFVPKLKFNSNERK